MGSAADPRRTNDARDRGQRIDCWTVHDQNRAAAFAGVDDVPAQSGQRHRIDRFVRGAHHLFQVALWPGDSSPRAETAGKDRRPLIQRQRG